MRRSGLLWQLLMLLLLEMVVMMRGRGGVLLDRDQFVSSGRPSSPPLLPILVRVVDAAKGLVRCRRRRRFLVQFDVEFAAKSARLLATMLERRLEEGGLVGEESLEGDAALAVGLLLVDALDRDEQVLVFQIVFVRNDRHQSRQLMSRPERAAVGTLLPRVVLVGQLERKREREIGRAHV